MYYSYGTEEMKEKTQKQVNKKFLLASMQPSKRIKQKSIKMKNTLAT